MARFVITALFSTLLASAAWCQQGGDHGGSALDSVDVTSPVLSDAAVDSLVAVARAGEGASSRRAWTMVMREETRAAQRAQRSINGELLDEALRSGRVDLRAAEAYLRALVQTAGDDEGTARLVAQLAIFSEGDGEALTDGTRAKNVIESGALRDPVPATRLNERLIEHLRRVAHALQAYAWNDGPTGFDERGVIWVKHGAPDRIRSVAFDDGQLLQEARRLGVGVTRPDFPDNEVWVYDIESDQGVFLFVRSRGGSYAIGDTNDLIPRSLRSRGVGRSPRAEGFSIVGLLTMRYVLSQLALYHPSFSNRYSQIQNSASYIEESQMSARVSGRGQYRAPPIAGLDRGPRRGFQQALTRNESEDEGLRLARDQTMPAETSAMTLDSVRVRVVRYLGPEGRTTRMLLWSVEGDGMRSSVWRVGGTPLSLAEEEGAGDFRREVDAPARSTVAVQIDRAIPLADSTLWRPVGSGYAAAGDDLDGAAALEVSDSLPFKVSDVVREGESLRAQVGRDLVAPLYETTLRGLDGIGIYLEAYVPSGAGVLRVRYRIERRRAGRLLRRSRVESDDYEFIRPVSSTMLPIAFLVDQANWQGADTLRLVIEVEDLGTGQSVQREVLLDVG